MTVPLTGTITWDGPQEICHVILRSARAAQSVTPSLAMICASLRSPRCAATLTAPGRRLTRRATDSTSRPAMTRKAMTSACNGASLATSANAASVSRHYRASWAALGAVCPIASERPADSEEWTARCLARRRPSSTARRLAAVNTQPRQAISSPRKRVSPRTTVTHASAATSSSTSPETTRRYLTKAGVDVEPHARKSCLVTMLGTGQDAGELLADHTSQYRREATGAAADRGPDQPIGRCGNRHLSPAWGCQSFVSGHRATEGAKVAPIDREAFNDQRSNGRVTFLDYTEGPLATTAHIAQLGPARAAWFHDPDGETLGLRQG